MFSWRHNPRPPSDREQASRREFWRWHLLGYSAGIWLPRAIAAAALTVTWRFAGKWHCTFIRHPRCGVEREAKKASCKRYLGISSWTWRTLPAELARRLPRILPVIGREQAKRVCSLRRLNWTANSFLSFLCMWPGWAVGILEFGRGMGWREGAQFQAV